MWQFIDEDPERPKGIVAQTPIWKLKAISSDLSGAAWPHLSEQESVNLSLSPIEEGCS